MLDVTHEAVPVSVLLVDDYPVVREGLKLLIEAQPNFRVVAQTGSGGEVRHLVLVHKPDVVLFDLTLDGHDGLALISQIAAVAPDSRILVNSMMSEAAYAERTLRAGAVGYIMKSATKEEFVFALRMVGEGRIYLSPKIFVSLFRDALTRTTRQSNPGGLSDRELHVFQLIGAGIPNREISLKMGISVKTVEAHRENIKNKLSLHDAKELAAAARQHIATLRC